MKKRKRKPVDYTGQRFGRIVAVEFHKIQRYKRGHSTLWWFLCDCGQRFSARVANARGGHTQSCGCFQRESASESQRLPAEQTVINAAYSQHKLAAKRRDLVNYLTLGEYAMIVKQPCYYCGDISKRRPKRQFAREPVQCNSADRRNNEPYYKITNTVPACFLCQRMKHSLSEVTFLQHTAKISDWVRSQTT